MLVAAAPVNLTAASTVVLLDPWWNPAVDRQAYARVHRIGQLRPVTVLQLAVRGTVEGRVLALQRRKRALARHAFDDTAATAAECDDDDDDDAAEMRADTDGGGGGVGDGGRLTWADLQRFLT